MPLRKVRKFFQVSLPAQLSRKFGIAEGDYVEMEETNEGILVNPVVVKARAPAARLTPREQRGLERAKARIHKINADRASANGRSTPLVIGQPLSPFFPSQKDGRTTRCRGARYLGSPSDQSVQNDLWGRRRHLYPPSGRSPRYAP
jgi:AbrB family looped-hinge helix DNA binding protein